ncbi:integrase arm-type DNA-binding domain-containing protein [Mesorhizobium sp. BR115XR7A]|uniref:tyrosine-type recombinase/integrase n=1 Tax=Mesorhizobium sp. BR115XR7A TaxID=2876645 RepID=UPI001CCCF083|nr:integrase arm-type DNA-binding domain-containing protein [Mesorhizobium sp. BR115XR7A]MBZ9907730.1 integrase arm-type DNA-binding domain-containing protein [Mesorhizobium sp. BR115XR7A]MBZ9929068.1 integrase arm-type DNA-binding domain-containing protein [Mesorhizobium sp. BR1-1-5]
MTLTDAAVRALKPGDKDRKIADAGGLFLLVTSKGARLWRLKYRFDSKEKTLAFGAYPDVGLAEARKRRDDAKRLLREGVDPSAQKRLDKITGTLARANTFDAVADEYVALQKRKGRATATIVKTEWVLDLARPTFGSRPINLITAPEILVALRQVEKRGRLETARRMRGVIGSVFRYGIASALCVSDPTQALKGAIAGPQTKHHAAFLEARSFGGLLRAIRTYDGTPEVRIALELSALLFPRPGEIRQAEWKEFDLAAGLWTVPAGRMKMRSEHRVPLPTQGIDILKNLQSITGWGTFLFPSTRFSKKPLSDNALNAALRRMGFTKAEATAHGFRATASTLLNESGKWSIDAIERQLAHKDADSVRRAYHRGDHWEERVQMMQWWANQIDEMRGKS